LLWTFGDWKNRQRLLWSFVIALGILIVAGEFVLHGWISDFYDAVISYRHYTGGAKSILEVLTGGWWLTILVGAGMAILCWQNRRVESASEQFSWMTALVLATTVIIVPKTAPYNQVLLLPGVLFLFMKRGAFANNWVRRTGAIIVAACVAWTWVGAICMMLASAALPQQVIFKAWLLPVYTTFATPVLITLGLLCLM
jgi:hypothetical protein